MSTNKFPPSFLRGIPNDKFIDEDGQPSPNIFRPHDTQPLIDDWYKISINWEDDENALDFTLLQKKDDDSFHFKGGVARLDKTKLDILINEFPCSGNVDYERDKKKDNRYHGNLLLYKTLSEKRLRREISDKLLWTLSVTIINKYYQQYLSTSENY